LPRTPSRSSRHAQVEPLQRARERQRRDHEQQEPDHADAGLGGLGDGVAQRRRGAAREVEAVDQVVGEILARRHGAEHDQQRQQGGERLPGERHRPVEPLTLEEPRERAPSDVDHEDDHRERQLAAALARD
jgi:hypothetical protein